MAIIQTQGKRVFIIIIIIIIIINNNLYITDETWESIYLSGDIDITFNAFLFTFLHFESCFPVQYVNPKKKT